MATRAGIRELRQQLSRYVDRVKAGEVVDVTEHGKLVARLVPAHDVAGSIAALEQRGLAVSAASVAFSSLEPPPPVPPGQLPPSAIVAADRADERY